MDVRNVVSFQLTSRAHFMQVNGYGDRPGFWKLIWKSELPTTLEPEVHLRLPDCAERHELHGRGPKGPRSELSPQDLAVNKVLTLAGRDEARDFLDILFLHGEILPLGGLVWAAVGKDPGFTPLSLLELLRRRGKYRSEDFARLHLAQEVDLQDTKSRWFQALDDALEFINRREPDQAGCLYYSVSELRFVAPADAAESLPAEISPHFGRPGGVLPSFFQGDALAELARSAW